MAPTNSFVVTEATSCKLKSVEVTTFLHINIASPQVEYSLLNFCCGSISRNKLWSSTKSYSYYAAVCSHYYLHLSCFYPYILTDIFSGLPQYSLKIWIEALILLIYSDSLLFLTNYFDCCFWYSNSVLSKSSDINIVTFPLIYIIMIRLFFYF